MLLYFKLIPNSFQLSISELILIGNYLCLNSLQCCVDMFAHAKSCLHARACVFCVCTCLHARCLLVCLCVCMVVNVLVIVCACQYVVV